MKEWIWWIQRMTYCCYYETCIIWIHDWHEEKDEWDIQDDETYELMIECFWLMLFVGMLHFEEIQLFINMCWVLLFSFHFIDETGWFQELMKKGKDMKNDWVFFHSTHLCVVSRVWWNGCFSHCVSVSNGFTWTRAPPDHMCMSDMKPSTPCDCGWDEMCEGSGMII